MGILSEQDSVVIGRVRLRNVSVDGASDGRSASELLRRSSLRSHRVPAGGLLCIRTMHDPAPRMQPLGNGRTYPLPAWEHAVNSQLDRHAGNAARPVRGHIAAAAESVLFLDEAEVLACLAADWLNGTLSRNWWWRHVLKSHDLGTVLEKWLRSPCSVPAAMELLHAWRQDARFVAQMPDPLAEVLLDEVLRTHDVRRSPGTVPEPAEAGSSAELSTQSLQSIRRRAGKQTENHAPWVSFLDLGDVSRLTRVQLQFIVQTLLLRHAPGVARSPAFQRQLTIYAGEGAIHHPADELESDYAAQSQSFPSGSSERGAGSADVVLDTAALATASQPPKSHPAVDSGQRTPSKLDAMTKLPPSDLEQGADTERRTHPAELTTVEVGSSSPEQETLQREETSADNDPGHPLEMQRVHTAFGGTLFLLNVSFLLGYYSDFTMTVTEQLDMSMWDFLAMLGERFTQGKLREDALWTVLAELAGREEDQEPGESHSWLQAPDEKWIDGIAQQVTAFAQEALGRDDAMEVLCCQPASITVTATHLDAYFSMESHPIEIRMACLDRDPGWVPAGGRYVAYHFD